MQLTDQYDGWNVVAELNGTNGVIRTFMWGLDLSGTAQGAGGVGGLLAIGPASGNPSFVAYDGNGNVTGLMDAETGTTSGQFEYGPFGETIRLTPNANNQSPFRFSIESYFKDGTLGKLVGTALHPVRYTNSVELESSTNRFFTQEIKLDASGNDTGEWTKT